MAKQDTKTDQKQDTKTDQKQNTKTDQKQDTKTVKVKFLISAAIGKTVFHSGNKALISEKIAKSLKKAGIVNVVRD